MERITRLELATSTLARWRSTRWAKSAYLRTSGSQKTDRLTCPLQILHLIVVLPVGIEPTTRGFSVLCSTDWATEAWWRPRTDSNCRPPAWQAGVLTNWTTRPWWWGLQGSNLWPSACKADALPAELNPHCFATSSSCVWRLNYYITSFWICQVLFSSFFKFFLMCLPLLEATLILYHSWAELSRLFWKFFRIFYISDFKVWILSKNRLKSRDSFRSHNRSLQESALKVPFS